MTQMKLCIIDPAAHIPSLKTLFPEAEYYAHEPNSFFTYITTHHYTKKQNLETYGFEYRTDWDTITSSNYDYVFISVPLADFYNTISPELTQYMERMRNKIKTILDTNNFKGVALFDTYDYDYDPSTMNTEWRVNYYFKRNYNKTKVYSSNVFPFPYIMFVKPCILGMVINAAGVRYENKINGAIWAGGVYNHVDNKNGVYRMRKDIFNQIEDCIDTGYFSENDYIATLKKYKVAVDLVGVGDPNKRTIEILSNGTLMLSMCGDLAWGFDEGDEFHPDTFFKTASEFRDKLDRILNNEEHYRVCLEQQHKIVMKYFNKQWLRQYIEKNIGYSTTSTVSLFLTSCNRPQLLKQTLESFVKYNTYPIEYGVIVEDSGFKGINDFAHSIVPFPLKIIYADQRRGQMNSIENGLQYLNTKYVFHCEEDWEFYNHGFIEESMRILKKNDKITSVWLRSHNEITTMYPIPVNKVDNEDYYIVGPDIGNFSWNPGLRTLEVQTMFTPYSTNTLLTICEGGLSKAFRQLGMTSAMTNKLEGYVKHIGWNNHVF
jgi:hypothetical protein